MSELLRAMADALAGSMLRDRETVVLPIPHTSQEAFCVEIEAAEVLPAWTAARSLLPVTNRWPLVVTCWASAEGSWGERMQAENLFSRDGYQGADFYPAQLIPRSASLDLDAFYQRRRTEREELLATTETDESYEVSAVENARLGCHLDWYTPESQPLGLVFLPTPDGWNALAYVHWYAMDAENEGFIAALRAWHIRFGAELVAHYSTMLQFVVGRPPATIEVAREVAEQQVLLAPCTTELPGVSLEQHARALVDRPAWFLHERP